MLAPYLGENYVDGVYWTLIFELTFYFIVFLMLLFGLQKKLESIFIIWSYIFLISYFFGFDKYTYLGGYYYYFILGSLFAMLKKKKSKMTILSLLITYILCVNFAMDMSIKKNIGLSIHIVYWIVTCFCMFFYVLNTRKVSSIKLPYSAQIGALTYPLYLIHAHFGYMFLNQFANESNKLLMYSLLLLIVFSVSFLIHRLIEIKMHSFWKYLFYKIISFFVLPIERIIMKVSPNNIYKTR